MESGVRLRVAESDNVAIPALFELQQISLKTIICGMFLPDTIDSELTVIKKILKACTELRAEEKEKRKVVGSVGDGVGALPGAAAGAAFETWVVAICVGGAIGASSAIGDGIIIIGYES